MKKFISAFLLSSFFLAGSLAFSQSSFPTSVGTTWEYVSLNYYNFGSFVGPFPAFQDEIVKDTVAGGQDWHRVNRTSAGMEDHWYFRVDSADRVILLDSVVAGQVVESQIFDYSLNPGDTLIGTLHSVQDLGSLSMRHDYTDGIPPILESGHSTYGTTLIPGTYNGHYMEFLPGVGQIAYEFRCLSDGCPDPNFYLKRLSNGTQTLYEREFVTVAREELNLDVKSLEAHPNPCSEQLRVSYQITEAVPVALELFDLNGKKVHTFLKEKQGPGNYEFFLYPRESPLEPGIYLISLMAGEHRAVKKILYLR